MLTAPLRGRVSVAESQPQLVFFYSALSGRSRRVEGYLAQVFQRRHNHDTFRVTRVSADTRPDLAKRFRIDRLPTLLVVEDNVVKSRIVEPRGCRELEEKLRPWLR